MRGKHGLDRVRPCLLGVCMAVGLMAFAGLSETRADLLASDPAAMPGWSGTLDADYASGTDRLHVLIDHAVFAPGQYPGDATNKDTEFVYAYQAFNQTVSTVALTSLSVGLGAGSGRTVSATTFPRDNPGSPAAFHRTCPSLALPVRGGALAGSAAMRS